MVDDEQLEPHWKEGSPTKKMKQLSRGRQLIHTYETRRSQSPTSRVRPPWDAFICILKSHLMGYSWSGFSFKAWQTVTDRSWSTIFYWKSRRLMVNSLTRQPATGPLNAQRATRKIGHWQMIWKKVGISSQKNYINKWHEITTKRSQNVRFLGILLPT